MKTKLLSLFTVIAAVLMTGCMFGNEPSEKFDAQDGSAGVLSTEVTAMDDAAGELLGGGMAKSVSAQAETIQVEIEYDKEPWSYSADGQCFVRKAKLGVNGDQAYRLRKDTVWLYDANGGLISDQTLAFGSVASYRHVRVVERTYQNTFLFTLDMTVQIDRSGTDTYLVKNGTITGSMNATEYRTTTVTNVKRKWLGAPAPYLGFPVSGSIAVDRPLRTMLIDFDGDASAVVTVTRKRDNQQVVYVVNINTGTESDS